MAKTIANTATIAARRHGPILRHWHADPLTITANAPIKNADIELASANVPVGPPSIKRF
jgi:hypothetical protein